MKNWIVATRMLALMTVLTGLIYPLVMTGFAHLVFPTGAGGSLIERDGRIVGSEWIAQKTESPMRFWPRPSATDFSPLPSGGSNLGPISADLKAEMAERSAKPSGAETPPQELLLASGSGLDPHLSPDGALFQAARVAQARGLDVAVVRDLVRQQTEGRQFGIFGEPRVNVLRLNLALEALSPKRR